MELKKSEQRKIMEALEDKLPDLVQGTIVLANGKTVSPLDVERYSAHMLDAVAVVSFTHDLEWTSENEDDEGDAVPLAEKGELVILDDDDEEGDE